VVARIALDGEVSEHALAPDCEPHGLAFAHDDSLWVARETGQIARLTWAEGLTSDR
jgi:virginiamycin B lyase